MIILPVRHIAFSSDRDSIRQIYLRSEIARWCRDTLHADPVILMNEDDDVLAKFACTADETAFWLRWG